MDSYQVVADTLGGRDSRKVANNSYLVRACDIADREGRMVGKSDSIAYRLHGTYVVIYHVDRSIELNTGGWRTVTTKERINRCFSTYGPTGYRVYSDRRVWKLYLDGQAIATFADGMRIHADGRITGALTIAQERDRSEHNTKLAKLVRAYIAKLTPADVVKACENMAGDCLFCQFERGGAPVAGSTHLWDHLRERYYMGTLFLNAFTNSHAGHAMPAMTLAAAKGEYDRTPRVDSTLTRALTRYFDDRLRWQ